MQRHGPSRPHSPIHTRHVYAKKRAAIHYNAFPTVVLERLIGILQGRFPRAVQQLGPAAVRKQAMCDKKASWEIRHKRGKPNLSHQMKCKNPQKQTPFVKIIIIIILCT